MTKHRFFLSLALTALVAFNASLVNAQTRIPTNFGNGADAEVRESNPTRKDGFGTELATRIRDGVPGFLEPPTTPGGPTSDRSSIGYVRIDTRLLTLQDVQDSTGISFQMTYRNTNINQGRVEATTHFNADGVVVPSSSPDIASSITRRAGLNFWALNIGHPGNNWIEDPNHPDGIHYNNAPGLAPDANIGTIDIDPNQFTFLGQQDFPNVTPANWLPVGHPFVFSSPELTQFLLDMKAAGQRDITIAFSVSHDGNPVGVNESGNAVFDGLTNFNYLFNPKEMVTLNNDPNFNPNTIIYGPDPKWPSPGNPIGSQADNSFGAFSPALVFNGIDVVIPEPSSMVLFGIGIAGVSLVRRRK